MAGTGQIGARPRANTYCVVPSDLAGELHELLRRHFAGEESVEVIVEQRERERRSGPDRRRVDSPVVNERRRIHNALGRRVGERRAALLETGAPLLPRRARRHATRILFVERIEPSSERLEDMDTDRLVTRFQAGEREVFAAIYMRYFDRVYSYLHVVTRDAHEAEDLSQDVFAKALKALADYQLRGLPFRAWLFTIVRRHAITELRKTRRLEVTDPVELPIDATAEDEEAVDTAVMEWITDSDLILFIERLPDSQRQVLVLRYMLGLKTSEIAVVLDRTESNVRMLHSRALRFLAARLSAVGRAPSVRSRRPGMRRRTGQVPVLRERRFALLSPWTGTPLRGRPR